MKKAIWISVGFLLFILGFSALVLSLVGVQFSFLTWIEAIGPLAGLIIKLAMIIGGIIIVYLTVTDWQVQDE